MKVKKAISELEKQLSEALKKHPGMEGALRQIGPGHSDVEIARAIFAVAYREGCRDGEEQVCKDLELVVEIRRSTAVARLF